MLLWYLHTRQAAVETGPDRYNVVAQKTEKWLCPGTGSRAELSRSG